MDWSKNMDGVQAATAIHNALVGTRLSENYRAAELLDRHRDRIDLDLLRTLLIKSATDDFYPGKEDEDDDNSISRTRTWLLGALGKIAAGDDAATKLVVRHLDEKFERHEWGRYWALEGLINGAKHLHGRMRQAPDSRQATSAHLS